jgi:hypothetical protein
MYKITAVNGDPLGCIKMNNSSIPFDPTNSDYQQFKQAINDDTAQLEDADGVLMTAEEAKAFVAALP